MLFLKLSRISKENIIKFESPQKPKPFQAQTGHLRSPSLRKRATSVPRIYVNRSPPFLEICTNGRPPFPERVFFVSFTGFLCKFFFAKSYFASPRRVLSCSGVAGSDCSPCAPARSFFGFGLRVPSHNALLLGNHIKKNK